jgi:mono/diheme cytochrome c family protein
MSPAIAPRVPGRRRRLRDLRFAGAGVALASLALVWGAGDPPPPVPPERLAFGIEVYLQSYCGACHALAAAGTAGAFGPSHDDARSLAELRLRDPNYRGAATTPADYIRESIVDPGAYIVPGYAATPHGMPAYGNLSDEALDALVALLLQP